MSQIKKKYLQHKVSNARETSLKIITENRKLSLFKWDGILNLKFNHRKRSLKKVKRIKETTDMR